MLEPSPTQEPCHSVREAYETGRAPNPDPSSLLFLQYPSGFGDEGAASLYVGHLSPESLLAWFRRYGHIQWMCSFRIHPMVYLFSLKYSIYHQAMDITSPIHLLWCIVFICFHVEQGVLTVGKQGHCSFLSPDFKTMMSL